MFGFLNTNRWFSLSSTQSISLPIMLNKALLSIKTLTPSCSTSSSNVPGFSTYSRLYASPEHPRFFTPTRINFGSGSSSKALRCATALNVRFIAAFRGRNRGRPDVVIVLAKTETFDAASGAITGLLFCASCSDILKGSSCS